MSYMSKLNFFKYDSKTDNIISCNSWFLYEQKTTTDSANNSHLRILVIHTQIFII